LVNQQNRTFENYRAAGTNKITKSVRLLGRRKKCLSRGKEVKKNSQRKSKKPGIISTPFLRKKKRLGKKEVWRKGSRNKKKKKLKIKSIRMVPFSILENNERGKKWGYNPSTNHRTS